MTNILLKNCISTDNLFPLQNLAERNVQMSNSAFYSHRTHWDFVHIYNADSPPNYKRTSHTLMVYYCILISREKEMF